MKWLKKRFQKVWIPVGVVLSLVLTSFSGISFVQPGQVEAEETEEVNKELANPRIVPDSSMEAGQKVTWDCVWFGSYPQAEVVPEDVEYTALPEELLQEGDLIEDNVLYNKLQNATGWSGLGDIEIGGEKYHRINAKDATQACITGTSISHDGESIYGIYEWENKTTFHYFKYQPVKWRILSLDSSGVLLLADKVLDFKKYNKKMVREDVTWENSDMRNWLNGLTDYQDNNFIDKAFSNSEKSIIKESYIENKDNLYDYAEGGNDTIDKIFLLSESEVYTKEANKYCFVSDRIINDEARISKSSVFAKAMGTESFITCDADKGNCYKYGLRSPGFNDSYDVQVGYISGGFASVCNGQVSHYASYDGFGVRPALNFNTELETIFSNFYSYAGTVCSDGTVNEIKPGAESADIPESNTTIKPSAKPENKPEINKKLSNPRISPYKITTWDCVWFGSYPQAEVVPEDAEYTALSEYIIQEGDLIKNNELYSALQNETQWDKFGNTVINGEKYHRIKADDATYINNSEYRIEYYNWEDKTTFHYFKYQPVKWRVLSFNGSEVLLLADKVLDNKQYHINDESVTWETSDIRSWLNGYVSQYNFIDTAFSEPEQSVIKESYVYNKGDNPYGTDDGNDTTDKIFLLSSREMSKIAYGFNKSTDFYEDDVRISKSSVFAKAMGTLSSAAAKLLQGACKMYCLRSKGRSNNVLTCCTFGGQLVFGKPLNYRCYGVRPALKLNLSVTPEEASPDLYSYAGTVCSDGTIKEIKPENTPEASPSAEPTNTPEASPSAEPTNTPEASPSVEPTNTPEAGAELSNPVIEKDSSMEAGQKVTWDCVWFGSYPQAEVVPEDAEYTVLSENLIKEGDLIKDSILYNALKNEKHWDEFGDTVINGEKYRRLKATDATYISSVKGIGYNWENNITFHYFKYQPVKWRVLSFNGKEALLLADKTLDERSYNDKAASYIQDTILRRRNVTWQQSTIRSWLNGYSLFENMQCRDYLKDNFINTIFNMSEQSVIKESYIENKDSLIYDIKCGNDTIDKIFLLSETELHTKEAKKYGFISSHDINDEARKSKSSVFAKAMGVSGSIRGADNCHWWLRSSGSSYGATECIWDSGMFMATVPDSWNGVRPALNLNLQESSDAVSSNLYSYAGTVCSDGTINEINPGTKPVSTPEISEKLSNPKIEKDISIEAGQKVTWDCVWFGSYPQAEVVPSRVYYTSLDKNLLQQGDLIVDDTLYNALQKETNWDESGNIVINGEKYRRISTKDATYVNDNPLGDKSPEWNAKFYNWEDLTAFHYFKYQPVKWRVLSVDDNEALLLADKVLDDKKYNINKKDVTWDGSTIRSWLNGYYAGKDIQNTSYLKDNFINAAFNVSEQSAIKDSHIENKDNLYGVTGGNNTTDKIFLLTEPEVYTDQAVKYGFIPYSNKKDEARISKSSVFAKARGVRSSIHTKYFDDYGNCDWWLCSLGNNGYNSICLFEGSCGVIDTDYPIVGIRPALKLNLNVSFGVYSYAGTVCSNNIINEVKPGVVPGITPGTTPTPTPLTPFIPYNVPSGGGSVNVPTQTPEPTVLPTVSPAPTDVPVVPQTPKPAETGAAPIPETDNKPSQTNVSGSTAKPDEETGNNSNIDNSDIDNSNTDNTNNSGNIKISKGSMVTDKKTKAVYKVIKNGKKNTVQYINNTKKNASSVTIPNKIKINGKSYKVDSIGKGAFKNNKKLKKVKIGKNIKTIGKGAFAGCKNLTDVEIGENVTEIKENAFSKCTSLVMVTIPAKVNKIGNRAFYKCKNLQYILVKSNKLMESNIGKEVFSGGFSTPRIKTDKSKWELYQKIFTARGMSQKALYIIDPVKLIP